MSWLSGIEMAADRFNHSHELPVPGGQVSETGPLSLMIYTISRLGGETRNSPTLSLWMQMEETKVPVSRSSISFRALIFKHRSNLLDVALQ